MTKTYARMISALFAVLIGGTALWMVAAPDRDFSPTENKYLSQFPTLKLDDFALAWPVSDSGDIFTGKWMSQFETYITDQFPLRDSWIAAKARLELALGKGENNGIYVGDKETLIPEFTIKNPTLVQNNLASIQALMHNSRVPVHFGLIPGKVTIWADRLPENAPNDSELEIIEQAKKLAGDQWIDLLGTLSAHADEDIFYRTDHHWTSLGAYYGYVAIMEGLGLEPVSLDEYEKITVSTDFNGTTYSSSGVRWFTPDVVDIYVPDVGLVVTSQMGMEPEPSTLYDWDKLEVKDKYSFFLGGNQAMGIIKTEHTDAPKILVIRDSFSDAMAPFLTAHFSEIHLFDARYNKTSVQQYVMQNGIDEVLVLYSVDNFSTDTNMFVLGK